MAKPKPNLANLRPWQPGQSGNPSGYSVGRRVSKALVRVIADDGAEDALARTWLAMALGDEKSLEGRKPNFQFFRELLDRVEGRTVERHAHEFAHLSDEELLAQIQEVLGEGDKDPDDGSDPLLGPLL